jgi:hypothetical protein
VTFYFVIVGFEWWKGSLRIWETDEEQATTTAKYRDLSTAAASAPPSVEMTFDDGGGENRQRQELRQRQILRDDKQGATPRQEQIQDSSPFDFAQGHNHDVKQNKNKQQQMRGFFAALRMTT